MIDPESHPYSASVKAKAKILSPLAIPLKKLSELSKIISQEAQSGDVVIFIGAGDISKWAYDLFIQMKKK